MDLEQLEHFNEKGYVVMKGLLDTETVDSVRDGCNQLTNELIQKLISKGKNSDDFKDEPFETRLLKVVGDNLDDAPLLYRSELHKGQFYKLFSNPRLLGVVHQILSPAKDIRIFPNYSIRPKFPDYCPHEVVWHQDAGLAPDGSPNTAPLPERMDAFGRDATVNCWTPLVPATVETGCMKFIPGSHKLGIQEHKLLHRYRETATYGTESVYGTYATQIPDEVIEQHKNDIIDIECDPGDVVFFSHILIHRGGYNHSKIIRWSVDWRYQDAAKETHREQKGHIMWSDDPTKAVSNAEQWEQLSLV
ncbi:unnamed protein product [Owenia fusiformis]|uniref:Uncharacterized protein n=1 Tax=Owenia fusiformis TaxID=6347 RepID=A0A8J1TBX8_OWEFU|nr:unnamed protein product [Owenia fusiformis]